MSNSAVEFNHRRQKVYANTSAETGQSVDLACGAGLEPKSKTTIENASIFTASESNIRMAYANLGDTAKTPGVVTGMTGAPSIDEPASNRNQGQWLERLLLETVVDNDERQAELAEERIESSKEALKTRSDAMIAKTDQTLRDMAEAADSAKLMKVFGWALTGLAVVAGVVTAGTAIAAAGAAAAAATGTGAAVGTGAVVGTGAAASTGAAVGATNSTFTNIGLNIAKEAVKQSIQKSVTETLKQTMVGATKEALAEAVKQEVAKQMLNVTAQQIGKAATKVAFKALASSAMTLGLQVSTQTGATGKLAEKLSWDDNNISGQIITGILSMGLMLSCGISNVNTLMQGITSIVKGGVAQAAGMVATYGVNTAMSLTTGSLGIHNAVKQYDAQTEQSEATELKAQLQLVRQVLEENQEDLQILIDKLNSALGDAVAVIDSANQAQKKIAEEMAAMA